MSESDSTNSTTQIQTVYSAGDPVKVLAADGQILHECAHVTGVLGPGADGRIYYTLDTGSPGGWPESGLALVDNLILALQLAARGWYVFPCHESPWTDYKGNPRKGKDPYWNKQDLPHGKDNATTDPALIRRWWGRWPGALVGIYCELSGLFAVDIDTKNDHDGYLTWQTLVNTYGGGDLPEVGPAQETPSGGAHLLFALPADLKIPNNAGKLGGGLDLRSDGYICTGGAYKWLTDHGHELQLTDAPAWLLSLIRSLAMNPPAQPATYTSTPTPTGDSGEYWLNKALARAGVGNRNETGFWLACQLRDSGMGKSEAESVMVTYAGRVPQGKGDHYSEHEALASLAAAYTSPARTPARGAGSVTYSGNGHHPGGSIDLSQSPGDLATTQPAQPEKAHLTDLGNGQRFATQHTGRALYVEQWGWLIWNGQKWEIDESGLAMLLAKQTVKRLHAEAQDLIDRTKQAFKQAEQAGDENDPEKAAAAQEKAKALQTLANQVLGWALKSQARPRIESILALGKSEPGIAARPADFDRDSWLLNCANGVLDLKTGELSSHDPRLRITKIAGAAYDPGATCPRWLSFLNRVFAGDQTVIDFIQRAAGYTLTGNTGEHCLFFLYGSGANGKSTFTETLQAAFGDYARKTPTDTLMIKYQDSGVPNDLARLAGARMVTAAELAEGKRLNESMVKDLTGGDAIAARYLHREFFEFTPLFKLWMYGNHQPIIRGTDYGIWRRINLIPFTVVIPEAERDSALPDKLRAELAGILAWAVRGCMAWQRDGLKPPASVKAATEDYRASQDILGNFLAECCITSDLATAQAGDLYAVYKTWATENGLESMSSVVFSRRLTEKGFRKSRQGGSGRQIYSGLGLLEPAKSRGDV